MTHDEIALALRMLCMGRPQAEVVQQLALALAGVLATPDERLQSIVQDAPSLPAASEVEVTAVATAKRPGRPLKGK